MFGTICLAISGTSTCVAEGTNHSKRPSLGDEVRSSVLAAKCASLSWPRLGEARRPFGYGSTSTYSGKPRMVIPLGRPESGCGYSLIETRCPTHSRLARSQGAKKPSVHGLPPEPSDTSPCALDSACCLEKQSQASSSRGLSPLLGQSAWLGKFHCSFSTSRLRWSRGWVPRLGLCGTESHPSDSVRFLLMPWGSAAIPPAALGCYTRAGNGVSFASTVY